MEDKNKRHEYDPAKRNKAGINAVLRAIVAFYLVYLGALIVRGIDGEAPAVRPWIAITICVIFCASAVGFIVYTMKKYRADLKAAEVSQEENPALSGKEKEREA